MSREDKMMKLVKALCTATNLGRELGIGIESELDAALKKVSAYDSFATAEFLAACRVAWHPQQSKSVQ